MASNTLTLYNSETGNFRIATIKQIREIYFEGMSQHTFINLFSDQNRKDLTEAGFKTFKGYQNPKVVEYIVETVGRINIKKGNERK